MEDASNKYKNEIKQTEQIQPPCEVVKDPKEKPYVAPLSYKPPIPFLQRFSKLKKNN